MVEPVPEPDRRLTLSRKECDQLPDWLRWAADIAAQSRADPTGRMAAAIAAAELHHLADRIAALRADE